MKQATQGLIGLAPRRKSAGYTQEAFASALGIKRSLLAAWETGRTWPSARWLPPMAKLLRCPMGDLYRIPADTVIIPQEGGEDHAG